MNKWRLACPGCNSEDHLVVATTQWVRATEKGFTNVGSQVISPTARIKCEKCGFNGFYKELKDLTGA